MRSLLSAELMRIADAWEAASARSWQMHDPDICGLDLSGEEPVCPGCLAGKEEANEEKAQIAGEFHAAGSALADLFFLLLRYATQHDHKNVEAYFVQLLRPALQAELRPIVQAIAQLERVRR